MAESFFMPRLKIDGLEIEVPKGTKVMEAADRLGIVIPRFCYHPALGPAGACRMCAVMFGEGPVKGVQMSCMVDAHEGMVVSTTHPEAVAFRKQVIEWLMMNHPHDCPVCDEGGQCLLQDMTVSGSHGLRRYRGEKRTYRDQYLGGFIQHEMNRCIHCYRCSRFYQDFAGYRDLGPMQIAHRTYFGRYQEGPLESPFSGNLVDVCPTGVFTDKTARFQGRRWDFERGPSLCILCSLGCRTVGSARYREVVLMEAGFSEAVNGYFICDRGRFGFHYANHPARPRQARIGKEEAPWVEAVRRAAEALDSIRKKSGPDSIATLSSARSSLENQGMLNRLCRRLGWKGPASFENRAVQTKVEGAVRLLGEGLAVSLREIEQADFILIAGADPVNEAPMLALALRQAFRHGGSIIVVDPRPISLPFPFEHLPLVPGDIELYTSALVKNTVDRPAVAALGPKAAEFFDGLSERYPGGLLAEQVARMEDKLKRSQRPVLVCGTDIVLESTPDLAANQAMILKAAKGHAGLFYVMPGANAFGAALLSPAGGSCEEIVQDIETGRVKALVIVESDPFGIFPDRQRLREALGKLDLLLVMDYLPSKVGEMAHVFFPTATSFETESSFVNQEGRLQSASPFYSGGTPVVQVSRGEHPPRAFNESMPGGGSRPAWEILADLGKALARGEPGSFLESTKDLWKGMLEDYPILAGVKPRDLREGVRLQLGVKGQDFFSLAAGEPRPPSVDNSLDLLSVDQTFGTEELSGYSRFIPQEGKTPRLYMQSQDALRLGLGHGDKIGISLDRGFLEVELCVVENMASGMLFLPRHRHLEWQKFKELPAKIPIDKIKKI